MSNPPPEEQDDESKTDQMKQGTLKALEGSGRFTAEEQNEIASMIESEVSKLLPDLPDGIAEIAFKALGLSLGMTDKLLDQQKPPPTDDKTDS
jgi:hypothetical protein